MNWFSRSSTLRNQETVLTDYRDQLISLLRNRTAQAKGMQRMARRIKGYRAEIEVLKKEKELLIKTLHSAFDQAVIDETAKASADVQQKSA